MKYQQFKQEFESSGLSQAQYAKQKGISSSMVSYYLSRARKEKDSKPNFTKLEVIKTRTVSVIKIRTAQGVEIEIPISITDNNLKPILIEPNINTYNLNTSLIEQYITKKTKAIMPVHLYGQTCWNKELENIAQKYNLKIVEDSHAHSG